MSFGETIRRLRCAKGWSSGELADESGVSRAYLWQLETGGKTQPSFAILEKLAKALGVPVSEFSEVKVEPRQERPLPAGLAEFVRKRGRELGLTKSDVEVMRNIHFRGIQPRKPQDWELLFLFLKKWAR